LATMGKIFKKKKKQAIETVITEGEITVENKQKSSVILFIKSILKQVPKKRILLITVLLVVFSTGVFMYKLSIGRNKNEITSIEVAHEFFGELALLEDESMRFLMEGDSEQALKLIDDYIQSEKAKNSKERAFVYSLKSLILTDAQSYDQALEWAQKTINENPKDPRYQDQIAIIYKFLGNKVKSREHSQEALRAYDEGLPKGYDGPSREYYLISSQE
jgi:tetratricopeptide (TPR) repeat protein